MDLLPCSAGTEVWIGGCETRNFVNSPRAVQPITAKTYAEGCAAVRAAFEAAEEPLTFPKIAEVCKGMFRGEGLMQNAPLGYAVVYAMLQAGEIELSVVRVKGMNDTLTAPSFRLALKR